MVPGTVNELSLHDRMILDLENTANTAAARDVLCGRIDLPAEKYAVVLEGLVDTDVAYSYAPDVVERIRRELAGLDWVTPKTIRKTVATTIYNSGSLDIPRLE